MNYRYPKGIAVFRSKSINKNTMTASELLEKIGKEWLNVFIVKGNNKIPFSICLNHKNTIKTNEGVNGIKLYSRKRFMQNVGNCIFELA